MNGHIHYTSEELKRGPKGAESSFFEDVQEFFTRVKGDAVIATRQKQSAMRVSLRRGENVCILNLRHGDPEKEAILRAGFTAAFKLFDAEGE